MSIQPLTLAQALVMRSKASPHRGAVLRKRRGVWESVSWTSIFNDTIRLYEVFSKSIKVKKQVVALMLGNRSEWLGLELALQALGHTVLPIYAATSESDLLTILNDSRAVMLICETDTHVAKANSVSPQLHQTIAVVPLSSLEPLFDSDEAPSQLLCDRFANDTQSVNDPATLVYTSGTEASPKGVLLSHQNIVAAVTGLETSLGLSDRDVSLNFLPFAHIMGRIELWACVLLGLQLAFCESPSRLSESLLEVRPTVLLGVPRIFEKLEQAARARMSQEQLVIRKGFGMAMDFALDRHKILEAGGLPSFARELQHKAFDRLYFQRVREKFGGRLKFAVSGGAPLARSTADFFFASGIQLLEGYGLTETCGPVCVNRPKDYRLGTVGKAMPGVEVKLGPDSELLIRGPSVMMGYNGLPLGTGVDDGWLATGDVAKIDADGFVSIEDRKKDLVVTAGGRNISPLKIELLFKRDSLFSNVLIVGDRRPFLVALVTLNSQEAFKLASQHGLPTRAFDEVVNSPEFLKLVAARIELVNAQLAGFEQIKRYKIFAREWSVDTGELTPSLKLRRKFLETRHQIELKELYHDA